jgi:hypothetical protein
MSAEESDGNVRQVPVLQRSGRAIDDELVEGQDIELQECERRDCGMPRSFLNTDSTSRVAHTGAFLVHSCCRQSIDAASFCQLSQASAKLFVASRRAFSSSNTSSGAPSPAAMVSGIHTVTPGMAMQVGPAELGFRYLPVEGISKRAI